MHMGVDALILQPPAAIGESRIPTLWEISGFFVESAQSAGF